MQKREIHNRYFFLFVSVALAMELNCTPAIALDALSLLHIIIIFIIYAHARSIRVHLLP